MLESKYRAYEIVDYKATETIVEGNLLAIADFMDRCSDDSIVAMCSMDGEPFIIRSTKAFYYCEDTLFLEEQLMPYLHGMQMERQNGKLILS